MNDESASSLLDKALPAEAGDARTFNEPWEAKAFAIIAKLAQDGYFEWSEWVECFSREVAAATTIEAAGGVPPTYYQQWVNAAEKFLVEKGAITKAQLIARRFAIGSVGPNKVMK